MTNEVLSAGNKLVTILTGILASEIERSDDDPPAVWILNPPEMWRAEIRAAIQEWRNARVEGKS